MLRTITLLLVLFIAPACAPDHTYDEAGTEVDDTQIPLVLLTDASTWEKEDLQALKDSLTEQRYRVIVSGFTGETAAALTARLPWLLQPGVGLFLYDERLSGAGAADSLRSALDRLGKETPVQLLRR